jgi:hypothetical protein
MKTVRVDLQCKVPVWDTCKHDEIKNAVCRFCVIQKQFATCALFNTPLAMNADGSRAKCTRCIKLVRILQNTVEDEDVKAAVDINPKDIIKYAIAEYQKLYNAAVKEGHPHKLAEKYASSILLNDNKDFKKQ